MAAQHGLRLARADRCGVTAQTGWDPSVKALTAYPQVLSMMDQNLQWTTALGNAYYNQPQDLLQTVQVLRERAQQAGNLQSTPQEQVMQSPGYIALAPANPDVVYVPTYNPWAVYGAPIAPYPNYSPLGALGSVLGTAVQYGLGFGVSAFMHTPFGLDWGLDWLANAILFNHSNYYSHSVSMRDWGLPHGGPRAFGRGGDWARNGSRYGGGYGFRNQQGLNRVDGRSPIARSGQGFDNRYQGGVNRGSNFGARRSGPDNRYQDNRYKASANRDYSGYGNSYGAHAAPSRNRVPMAVPRPRSRGRSRSSATAPSPLQAGHRPLPAMNRALSPGQTSTSGPTVGMGMVAAEAWVMQRPRRPTARLHRTSAIGDSAVDARVTPLPETSPSPSTPAASTSSAVAIAHRTMAAVTAMAGAGIALQAVTPWRTFRCGGHSRGGHSGGQGHHR